MTEHKPKLKYGEGKVEFLACLETIQELKQAGHCGKVIYRKLADNEDISMSYNAFHKYFSQLPGYTKRGSPPLVPVLAKENQWGTVETKPSDLVKTNSLAVNKEKINVPKKVPGSIKVPPNDGFHYNPIPKPEELI